MIPKYQNGKKKTKYKKERKKEIEKKEGKKEGKKERKKERMEENRPLQMTSIVDCGLRGDVLPSRRSRREAGCCSLLLRV